MIWIKDLNIRPETIKLTEENIGRTLYDINHSKILYNPPSRIKEIKTKIDKWDLLKRKGFCIAKETLNKVKRQPSEWEKIIASEQIKKNYLLISLAVLGLSCGMWDLHLHSGMWDL